MDFWAARLVYSLQSSKLVGVGSRVDGFISHILTFSDIEVSMFVHKFQRFEV